MNEQAEQTLTRMLVVVTSAAAALTPLLYGLAAATTWAGSCTLPPLLPSLVGALRVPWHLRDPGLAFDPALRANMPSAVGWWLIGDAWLLLVACALADVAIRVDAARGRRYLGLRPYDPRGWLTPRAFARPRDLRHLRTGQPDSWTTIRLDGRLIGTEPETHILLVAPPGSGKTTGPVTTWAVEHQGPAIITSSKADVAELTAHARAAYGPVWVYAPAVPDEALPVPACGWTPRTGCEDWEHAQMTGRWLAATTIGGNDVQESDGARFYNHEAGRLLACLLHAAALEGEKMARVNRWLRTEDVAAVTALQRHGADAAAERLAAYWAMDSRARSLVIASAGQLIDAYEYPSVERTDRPDFSPEALLEEGGTLFLVAPEGRQDMVRPLFSALLGAVFRAAELRAMSRGPLEPQLRVILDETRRLAAIDDLPALLSVSRGWGVRIATVWQNLGQIEARYGRQADEVLGTSLAKLVLGPIQDTGTRDYLVGLLDEQQAEQTTYDLDGLGGRRARSAQRRGEAKASAQTLQQLGRGEGLLIHGRDLPAVGRVHRYWERRDLNRLVTHPEEQHSESDIIVGCPVRRWSR